MCCQRFGKKCHRSFCFLEHIARERNDFFDDSLDFYFIKMESETAELRKGQITHLVSVAIHCEVKMTARSKFNFVSN